MKRTAPAILLVLVMFGCASSTPKTAGNEGASSSEQPATSDEHAADPGHVHEHESGASDPSAPSGEDLLAAERSAFESAKPIFDRHCARCHTSTGTHRLKGKALGHFNMDSYPFGGHHTDEMAETMRRVLGASGASATMPRDKPGTVQGDDLALLLAWTDAFERSHKAGLHDHTKGKHEHGGAHKHSDHEH